MIRQLLAQSAATSRISCEKLQQSLTDLSERSQQTLVGGSSQGQGNAGQIKPPPDRSQEVRLSL